MFVSPHEDGQGLVSPGPSREGSFRRRRFTCSSPPATFSSAASLTSAVGAVQPSHACPPAHGASCAPTEEAEFADQLANLSQWPPYSSPLFCSGSSDRALNITGCNPAAGKPCDFHYAALVKELEAAQAASHEAESSFQQTLSRAQARGRWRGSALLDSSAECGQLLWAGRGGTQGPSLRTGCRCAILGSPRVHAPGHARGAATTDVFGIQAEVAEAEAEALQVRLKLAQTRAKMRRAEAKHVAR